MRRHGRGRRKRRGGCWQSAWFWKAGRGSRRRKRARWTARRCVTGCIGTTNWGWRAYLIGRAVTARSRGCQPSSRPQWRNGSSAQLERDGVIRWRCVDLQRRIAEEFAVQLHERTVGKLLRKLSFRRLSVRPQHPQSKPEEQAVFSAALLAS